MGKTMLVEDMFTVAQLNTIMRLWNTERVLFHAKVLEQVIKPAMARIDEKTWQKNDAQYIAYALEYSLTRGK